MDLNDVVNAPASDFTSGKVNTFGSNHESAALIVRKAIRYSITDADEPGSIVFNQPIDTTITPEVQNEAKYWEKYSFSGVRFAIQSTSPFGSASGATQMAHVTDPRNANFGTDLAANLAKLIRTSGSIIIRPRDSRELLIDCSETLYTKSEGESRMTSFGNVIAGVRAKPSAGDTVDYDVTISGSANFFQPTIIETDGAATATSATIDFKKTIRTRVYYAVPPVILPKAAIMHFEPPVECIYTVKDKFGNKYTKTKSVKSAKFIISANPALGYFDFPEKDIAEFAVVPSNHRVSV